MSARKEKWRRALVRWGLPFSRPGDPGRSLPEKKRIAYVDGFLCVLMWGFVFMEPSPLNVLLASIITAMFAHDVATVRRHTPDSPGESGDTPGGGDEP